MTDYSDHQVVWQLLKDDQHAEHDLREQIKAVIDFQHKIDGQWEPKILEVYSGRPRYTFDQTKPLVSNIWSEMAANEYSATTEPVSDEASEEISGIYDGLLRSIYNKSSFDDISTKAGKRQISTGFSGWRAIAQSEPESFNQELIVKPLNNINERVWFDANSEMQTREDANHCHVVTGIGRPECERRWPKRNGHFENVDTDITCESYTYKPLNKINVGEILYKKRSKKTIYLLNDARVVDDEGLSKAGLTESDAVDSREIDVFRVFSRKHDGVGWLEDEKETVFSFLPVIPSYANFDVVEGKVTYEGCVRSIMDHCRILNYTESRKVEESILSPRTTIWLDDRLAEGRVEELEDLNRRPASVQLYRGGVEGAALPFQTPGPQTNPALSELSADMIRNIQLTSGMGNVLAEIESSKRDSDFRFDQRNSIGKMGTFEYYRGHKVALEHTAKVLIDAFPRVYDSERSLMVLDERGSSSVVDVNKKDPSTGEVSNDLTAGKFKVTLKVGPTIDSRQSEANTRLLELGDRVPGIIERNTDILAGNIDAPGMKIVSDRERVLQLQQGHIPESELTEEEIRKMQQASQQQTPDPASQIAQAELQRSQTEAQTAQFKALEAQAKLELAQNKQQADIEEKSLKLELDQMKAQMSAQSQEYQDLKVLADTLKTLIEATGADAAVSPEIAESISTQSELITGEQNEVR